ncbi:MAG: hypothetical protein AB1585_10630 [Thermodesulfobacteriota bacterium]
MGFFDLLKLKGQERSKEAVVDQVRELMDVQKDPTRQMMERIWWRNLLYYTGEQWIEYMRSTKTFTRKLLPPAATTPVSNKVRETVRSHKAMLLNQKRVPKISPNTNEREDREAARLGEQLLIWLDTLNDNEIDDEKEKCAIWTVISGTTFLRTFPDKDAGQSFFTPDGQTIRTGEVYVEHIIPFNVHLDPMGDKMRKKRWIGIESLKPREWVEDTFKVKLGKEETATTLDYQRRLMKLVAQVSPWKGDGIDTSVLDVDMDDLVVYRELELNPYRTFPNGRFIVTCQDRLLIDVERMPIRAENGISYYTLTDFHWNYVPGRFWSDGGVDDLISPQNTINKVDKALDENRQSLGRPRVLAPTELTLERLTERGESFLVMKYDGRAAGGQKPEFQNGTPYPQQVLEERAIAEREIQDAAGDPKNILKGVSPDASASGYKIDILRETAEQSHTPDVERFNRSMSRVYKKRLLLVKELYTEERMIKISGRGGTSRVKAFKGADLRNNTDLRLEIDSGLSTTRAGETQVLLDLGGKGFLGDLANDAEARGELLNRMGLTGFTAKENVDFERAEDENSAIAMGDFSKIMLTEPLQPGELPGEQEVVNEDPFFKYDNHEIHYARHRKFLLSEEAKYLPQEAIEVLIAHTDTHHIPMQAEMQARMMAAMGPPTEQGPDGSGTGKNTEMNSSKQALRPLGFAEREGGPFNG